MKEIGLKKCLVIKSIIRTGCGMGEYTVALAKNTQIKFYDIDIKGARIWRLQSIRKKSI